MKGPTDLRNTSPRSLNVSKRLFQNKRTFLSLSQVRKSFLESLDDASAGSFIGDGLLQLHGGGSQRRLDISMHEKGRLSSEIPQLGAQLRVVQASVSLDELLGLHHSIYILNRSSGNSYRDAAEDYREAGLHRLKPYPPGVIIQETLGYQVDQRD